MLAPFANLIVTHNALPELMQRSAGMAATSAASDAPAVGDVDEQQPTPSLCSLPADVLAAVLSHADAVTAARLACTCRALWASVAHASCESPWRAWLDRDWLPASGAAVCCKTSSNCVHAVPSHLLYRRWSAGQPVHTCRAAHSDSQRVHALAFGHGHELWSVAGGQLCLHDASHGMSAPVQRAACPEPGPLNALAICACSGGTLVAVGGANNIAWVFDTRAGLDNPAFATPADHFGEISALTWCAADYNADGARPPQWESCNALATGGGDDTVRVWDMRYMCPVRVFDDLPNSVYALAWDCRHSALYAASGKEVSVLDAIHGEWVSSLRAHSGDVYALALAEGAVLSGGDDGLICEWSRVPVTGDRSTHEIVEIDDALAYPEPVSTLVMTAHRRGSDGEVAADESSQGHTGLPTCVTSLIALGTAPKAFLAGTWDGYVVIADRSRGVIKPFGKAHLKCGSDEREVPVTALAARAGVVAVGHDDGVVRLMRLVAEDE